MIQIAPYLLHTPRRARDDWKTLVALGIVLWAFFAWGSGRYGLYDPWETHYGEVARNMVEHDNYIDPWWGSPWDPTDVKREREGFYSKPPLIMWMMAAGMNIAGYTELGVRLFFPIVAMLALLAMYLAVSRFYNRRAGLLSALVCATSPFYAFLSRQAVTDGPMVAIMTAGGMFLTIGLFLGDDEDEASSALYWLVFGLLLLTAGGQLWTILAMDRSPDIVRVYPFDGGLGVRLSWFVTDLFSVLRGKGWALALLLLPLLVAAARRVARERRRRMLYIYLFYICCGLTVPAKGWLGWAPLGIAIVGYLVISGEWKTLARVDIPTGLLLVVIVGHPWIFAMLGGHHPGWFDRFIRHDHINRLLSGVHSTDDGGFEYFFKWLGYGLFPWIGLLPGAIARLFGGLRKHAEGYTRRQKFEIFVLLWTLGAFFLLSKSSTKFHHYIFPAVPGFAILVALFIEDLLQGRGRGAPVLLLAGALVAMWVGQDLYHLPREPGYGSQQLVNIFTYKYDREWAKYTAPDKLEKLSGELRDNAEADNEWLEGLARPLQGMTGLAVIALVLMALFRGWIREYGTGLVIVAGVWSGWWCLQYYLPVVAEHWSQKSMWDAYYAHCTPFEGDDAAFGAHLLATTSRTPSKLDRFPRGRCQEPVVAFRTNWRGETFYSSNTVIPAVETKHLKPFLVEWGNDKPFYLFTERSRVTSELEPNLPAHLKGQHKAVYDNKKFMMLRVEKGLGPPPEVRAPATITP